MHRLLACLLVVSSLSAQDPKKDPPKSKVKAIKGARIYTLAGAAVDAGVILVENGKITAVGADVVVPEGAEVVDGTGKVVIPGLLDAASRVMLDVGDTNTQGSAELNVIDGLDLFSDDYQEAVRSGVTSVCVQPVNRGTVSGVGAVLKLNGRRDARVVLQKDACLRLSLAGGGDVSTSQQRFETYRQVKQVFEGARSYLEAWDKYRKELAEYEVKKKEWDKQQAQPKKEEPKKEEPKKEEPKKEEPKKEEPKKEEPKKEEPKKLEEPKKPQKPRVDPRNEVLSRSFHPTKPLLIRVEVHFADSIEYALKLAEEFKLKIVLDQCTEGADVADAIAKAKVPVIAGPLFRYGMPRVEYLNHSIGTPAALAKAGVVFAIGSFPEENAGHRGAGASRFLLDGAALASSKGLTREQALRAITLAPAQILGVDDRIGSIEKGKQADLVVLTGEPFDVDTKVERTMIDGEWVYQRK